MHVEITSEMRLLMDLISSWSYEEVYEFLSADWTDAQIGSWVTLCEANMGLCTLYSVRCGDSGALPWASLPEARLRAVIFFTVCDSTGFSAQVGTAGRARLWDYLWSVKSRTTSDRKARRLQVAAVLWLIAQE